MRQRTVAVIGLGSMGLPIASHVIRAGFVVRGWDTDADARRSAAHAGVPVASDLTAALRGADVCLVLVGSEDAVEFVVRVALDEMPPGSLQLVLGTIGAELAERLGRDGIRAGRNVLQTPLCRAAQGAVDASSLALVSGDRDAVDSARPVLESFCADIAYLGDGHAKSQVAKSINNLMLWAAVAANEEGFALAVAYDIDVTTLRSALVTSTADSWSLREWDHVAEWTWSRKDLRLLADVADLARVEVPLARELARFVERSGVLEHARDSH